MSYSHPESREITNEMAQAFRVLWFEDQLRDIASQRAELVDHALEDHGIDLSFEDCPVASDAVIDEVKRRQSLYHDFDFVVLDYDLGGGTTGDVVAARIRRAFGFVPMVFYSGSLGGVAELRTKLLNAKVDGVHCVTRRELVQFLIDQIDELLHPLSRIEMVRGSAIGVLAECDKKLLDWFINCAGELEAEKKAIIESRLDDNLAKSSKSREKQWGEKVGDLSWKIDRADSSQLMRISRTLAELLEMSGLPDQPAFESDLLKPRNTLGHAVAERTETGLVLRSKYGEEIGTEQLADLRRRMADMRGAILKFAVPKKAE